MSDPIADFYNPIMEEPSMLKPKVQGVGPDAPTITLPNGARQSDSPGRADLLPPLSLLEIAKVLKYGAEKYEPNNWRGIPLEDHLNHVLIHLLAYLAGDRSDDHLGHAACRMLFAHETALTQKPAEDVVVKHTAPDWNRILDYGIIDYDGFYDVTVSTLMSRDEFEKRAVHSTRKLPSL